MKDWIRNKLRKFLGIDLLEKESEKNTKEISKIKNDEISEIRKRIKMNNDFVIDRFVVNEKSLKSIQTTLENIVHIGTDVDIDTNYLNPRKGNSGHSWAVICIEGKVNIVKFVDLNGRHAQDILRYLKQFEAGRHCIDTPYKEIFYKELFRL